MKGKIHFNTVKQYFEDRFDILTQSMAFNNSQTGEIYYLICEQGTDIAFFTVKRDGSCLCLNSDGEPVDEKEILSYVNGEYVQYKYESIEYDETKLDIRYDGQRIDMNELKKLEEQMYPEGTGIVLNNVFTGTGNVESFYVNEIAYVDQEAFLKILNGENSNILKEYNKRSYEGVAGSRNGILVINKQTGDGLLVDTQGFDYARYISYAPQIKMPVEYMLEMQMKQDAVLEMKLYVPLEVTMYDEEEDHEYEVDGMDYYHSIKEKVSQSVRDCDERGLAEYFWEDDKCRNKVYSIKPDVEVRNNRIMGVAVIKMTKPLIEEELELLKDYVSGQFSDGWGEGFEQHEIEVGNGEIYVHFWNSENYYIHTEEEQQSYEMAEYEPAQGMQGMDMS